MAEPAICYEYEEPPGRTEFWLVFANDMDDDVTPPPDAFNVTIDGAPVPIVGMGWYTNHILIMWPAAGPPPSPPPKPTVHLPVFHRDLRYKFGTVYNAFLVENIDPCP